MASSESSLETIFFAALAKESPREREDYLAQACGAEQDLRQRVERLLKAHEQAANFMDQPAIAIELESEAEVGGMIGPYKLLEQIGEGGMGVVYMAEQLRPVRRKVALKLIKPGMDSRQVLARFEAERQALALMEHPNIARILDAGMIPLRNADCGLRIEETASEINPQSAIRNPQSPYFVMELVRGIPITDFCDKSRLSIRQRLELFATVCRAVQHAHQKGIIHRDLKPSNILVTLHDGSPVPKVIDFGVAKAMHEPLTERTLHTGFCQMLGTPTYMSPEQASLSGLDIDTRSDVYSLGVLLYELLTGGPPFDHDTLKKAGYDEFRRLIREVEPPIPSSRLTTLNAEAISTIADHRCSEPRKLGQLLLGELDWLVMKALEKDRNRRYESASALAADVERYLADEPVQACPPSVGYRTRKFLRRHKGPVAAAALVLLSLIGGIIGTAWQALRATAAQKLSNSNEAQAKAAERIAATESAIAKAVNDFLQRDLLALAAKPPQHDDQFGVSGYLTVREALDRAAGQIGERFKDQPLVEAAIRTTIGSAYNDLHEYQLAVSHLERAAALRTLYLGAEHSDTLASMVRLAIALEWVGRQDEAIIVRQRILENRKSTLGPDHPEMLGQIDALAIAYRKAGRWDLSVPLLEELLQKRRTVLGPTHPDTVGILHALAMNYGDVGRFDESVALHEKVLEMRRSLTGPPDQFTHWCMLTLAHAYQRVRNLDQANRLLRDALDIIRNGDTSLHRRIMTANTLGWLGRNMLLEKHPAAAERVLKEAVAIYGKELPDSPRRFYLMSLLGDVLFQQQKYSEAERLLQQGCEGLKQREAVLIAPDRYMLTEAGERLVRFYDATQQPEKASAWREKLQEGKKQ